MADSRFLTPNQLAEISLERLQLPVPMAKLEIIHGVARALDEETTHEATKYALLRWIVSRDLESEVLEALCILLLANDAGSISKNELIQSIARPSILSDHFVDLVYSSTSLIKTWPKCHSLEPPGLYTFDKFERELSKTHIVPPVLLNQLRELEHRTGLPFIRQWAYEFDQIQASRGQRHEGYLEFFSGDLMRGEGSGNFVSSRGHIARSAYLRVFSLAVDLWEMPEDEALHYAMYTTPVDLSFLQMQPGLRPSWVSTSYELEDDTHRACSVLVQTLLDRCEAEAGRSLIHFDGPICRGPRLQADLEIITFKSCGEDIEIQDAFAIHEYLPGKVVIDRGDDFSFRLPPWPEMNSFPVGEESAIWPAIIPTVTRHFGYIHSELIQRIPYLPVNHNSNGYLEAIPRLGGADIQYEDRVIGELHYWNDRWQPMHFKELGPDCAVAVSLMMDEVSTIFSDSKCSTIKCWRAKVYSRDREYGDWKESVHIGQLD